MKLVSKFYENYKNLTTRQNLNFFENRRLMDIVGELVLKRKMAEAILSRSSSHLFSM